MDEESLPKLVQQHLWPTNCEVRKLMKMFLSFLTHQRRFAATVENTSRGALALFQPLLYSHDAEAFIEGGFQDLEKGTQEFLKEPNGEVALSPVFLVRDVLLVASLSRNKPQATCGICHLEQGHMVGFFKNFFMPSELSCRYFRRWQVHQRPTPCYRNLWSQEQDSTSATFIRFDVIFCD